MRIAWFSDIHLDACSENRIDTLIDDVTGSGTHAVLIGGDISNANALEEHLSLLARRIALPIYFVLGNHDFYGSDFASVESIACSLDASFPNLHFLSAVDTPVLLKDNIALIGCGDWADGRLGDFWNSQVLLNDFRLIGDFAGWGREAQLRTLNELGDRAAERLDRRLRSLPDTVDFAIVLLHVPPFADAAWHEGERSNDEFLPFFSCKAVGDVLAGHFTGMDKRRCLTLCGHTHGSGAYRASGNLLVLTAGAEYGRPALQRIFDLDRMSELFEN